MNAAISAEHSLYKMVPFEWRHNTNISSTGIRWCSRCASGSRANGIITITNNNTATSNNATTTAAATHGVDVLQRVLCLWVYL